MNQSVFDSSKSAYLRLCSMPRTNQPSTPGTPVKPANFKSSTATSSKQKKKKQQRSQSATKSKKKKHSKDSTLQSVPGSFCSGTLSQLFANDQQCLAKKKSTKKDNLKALRCELCKKCVSIDCTMYGNLLQINCS